MIKQKPMKHKKWALYIGRWQTWHSGHEWLIQQQLERGNPVWIAIRDVQLDENNPKLGWEIREELEEIYKREIEEGKVMVSIIPDIESVNWGRDVGYECIEWIPPTGIGEISGTKIRKEKGNE